MRREAQYLGTRHVEDLFWRRMCMIVAPCLPPAHRRKYLPSPRHAKYHVVEPHGLTLYSSKNDMLVSISQLTPRMHCMNTDETTIVDSSSPERRPAYIFFNLATESIFPECVYFQQLSVSFSHFLYGGTIT